MRRQEAGADARRAPAGRGPGWPESIAWRKTVGFSGTSIQALVFARDVRLNGGHASGRFGYIELHTLSNFSFLRGASSPQELIAQAKRLNYRGLALTDECSLAGVVRAHIAAKQHGLPLIIGTEITCIDELKLVVLATDRASYGAMSRLISRARRASPKGRYALARTDFEDALDGCLIIWLPRAERASPQRQEEDGR